MPETPVLRSYITAKNAFRDRPMNHGYVLWGNHGFRTEIGDVVRLNTNHVIHKLALSRIYRHGNPADITGFSF